MAHRLSPIDRPKAEPRHPLGSRGLKAPLLLAMALLALPARAEEAARVKAAREGKIGAVKALFEGKGLHYPPAAIFIRVFKREQVLELWGRDAKQDALTHVKDYPVCASSGSLGPKRKEGDLQVPEGAYRITLFNPASAYHLSLGLDYPNASDRVLSDKRRPGGAIMIHGKCVTIGCIPIEDDGIEEVYLAASDTKDRTLPVHVFPGRMDAAGMKLLEESAKDDATLLRFWKDLKPVYDAFEAKRRLPAVTVGRDGRYRIGG
jgi:murein L,D-transpeptidase YafK